MIEDALNYTKATKRITELAQEIAVLVLKNKPELRKNSRTWRKLNR